MKFVWNVYGQKLKNKKNIAQANFDAPKFGYPTSSVN